MGNRPQLSLKDAERILYQEGFLFSRNNGGHNIYKHSDGRTAVLPDPGRRLGLKGPRSQDYLRKWLRQAGVSV